MSERLCAAAPRSRAADRQKVVVRPARPVDEPDRLRHTRAVIVGERDLDAITEQLPYLLVGANPLQRGTVAHQLLDRLVERRGREIRIQFGQLRPQPVPEDHLTGRRGRAPVRRPAAHCTRRRSRSRADSSSARVGRSTRSSSEKPRRITASSVRSSPEVYVRYVELAGDEAREEEVAGALKHWFASSSRSDSWTRPAILSPRMLIAPRSSA